MSGEFPIRACREDQQIQISSITPTFFWDRRTICQSLPRFFASASANTRFLSPREDEFREGLCAVSLVQPLTERSQFVVSDGSV